MGCLSVHVLIQGLSLLSFSAGILNFVCVCGGTSSPRTSASLTEFFAGGEQVEKEQVEGCAGEFSGQAESSIRHFRPHPIGWHMAPPNHEGGSETCLPDSGEETLNYLREHKAVSLHSITFP